MNHIRGNFQAQIDKANKLYEAASIAELERLAQTPTLEAKKMLFDKINEIYFKGKSPFGGRITISAINSSTMNDVYKFLNKNLSAANLLFELKKTGIGGGEIMMAYIVENMIIGGGSADVDLNLFDLKAAEKGKVKLIDEAELKEVSLTKDGFLKDWRTGAKHRNVINKALEELKKLYAALVDVVPELDPSTEYGREAERKARMGEWTQVVNKIKDIDPVVINNVKLNVQLLKSPEGDINVYHNGELLGSLTDSKVIKQLDTKLTGSSKVKVKSYSDIESDLAKDFGSIKEKFVFIRTTGETGKKKVRGIYYKENLPSNSDELKIYHITQNTIKVKVKA